MQYTRYQLIKGNYYTLDFDGYNLPFIFEELINKDVERIHCYCLIDMNGKLRSCKTHPCFPQLFISDHRIIRDSTNEEVKELRKLMKKEGIEIKNNIYEIW